MTQPNEPWTDRDAMKAVGCSSTKTILRMIRDGELPKPDWHVGRSRRWFPESIPHHLRETLGSNGKVREAGVER